MHRWKVFSVIGLGSAWKSVMHIVNRQLPGEADVFVMNAVTQSSSRISVRVLPIVGVDWLKHSDSSIQQQQPKEKKKFKSFSLCVVFHCSLDRI